jgi:hypothetical protein
MLKEASIKTRRKLIIEDIKIPKYKMINYEKIKKHKLKIKKDGKTKKQKIN